METDDAKEECFLPHCFLPFSSQESSCVMTPGMAGIPGVRIVALWLLSRASLLRYHSSLGKQGWIQKPGLIPFPVDLQI